MKKCLSFRDLDPKAQRRALTHAERSGRLRRQQGEALRVAAQAAVRPHGLRVTEVPIRSHTDKTVGVYAVFTGSATEPQAAALVRRLKRRGLGFWGTITPSVTSGGEFNLRVNALVFDGNGVRQADETRELRQVISRAAEALAKHMREALRTILGPDTAVAMAQEMRFTTEGRPCKGGQE